MLKNITINSAHYFTIKTPNKRKLQQIKFNHPSDIGFDIGCESLQKCTPKPYYFEVIDYTLASNNLLHFRENLLERIDMKNYNIILTEKQQNDKHYLLEKLINMYILQVKKYCLLIKDK